MASTALEVPTSEVMGSALRVRFASDMDDAPRKSFMLVFWFGFSLLIAHEMDAMVRHEWRMLPGFSGIADDATARDLFTLVHIPAFAVLLWLCSHAKAPLRVGTQRGVDAFLVLHGVAHALLSGDARYEFVPPVETVTVFGAGLVGAVHLWLSVRRAPR